MISKTSEASSLQLPLELWAEILTYLPSSDAASVARICTSFRGEAERVLYRSVSLTDNAIILFHRTITSSPHYASLVRRLDAYARVLGAQLDLHHLSLCFSRGAIWDRTVILSCQHIVQNFFPNLRSFRTNMSLMALPQLMGFMYSHTTMEELHLEMDDLLPPQMPLPSSLQTLTVMPRIHWGAFRAQHLKTITHLCLGRYGYEHFDYLADSLGAHLVSLRLSSRLGGTAWSLGDFVARFPRLRLLHVDMGKHINGPAMHPCPIDWKSKTCERHRRRDAEPRTASDALTIVWSYPHEDGVVLTSAIAWHVFLNEAAFDVLLRWSPDVERIVYRHTIIPYVCATLSKDHTRLIREKDVYMPDDYWKTV
ncbi:hypothetical protein BC628DRAFT_1406781 [Trametes gibbosa]|nr:hypothetical protein BC628DRAFT_1406781 [Trametes gibbosa]